jgi:hypothetical protein
MRLLLLLDRIVLTFDCLVVGLFLSFGLVGMWTDVFFLHVLVVGVLAACSARLLISAIRRTRTAAPSWRLWQIAALTFGIAKLPLLVLIYGAGGGPHK